ncbi:MAG: group II intron reverse transcriptase/maturase [Ignavibacteria bacterium]|jgi:RNA-directed DNA polymerase|nr:group II intron reverse transcriptase/maturase [Ignavibacteria bacterium]MCU7522789.1 group II intron reverse transcriptase/maturase [Ignavibacteria bacterium]
MAESAPEEGKLPSAKLRLIEIVVSRENMTKAYQRVLSNKGSAGVDNITVEELKIKLKTEWPRIKEELLSGRYKPQPVKMVKIPKPSGGERTLGIPTVLDRLIQQALQQVLSPIFDPGFSNFSYGFRAGRSAHGAILQAKRFQMEGRKYVVDMDIEKFFDEVNHDVLLGRIRRKIREREILTLIGRYLKAGMMSHGVERQREKGTPQGSPLSPLLSNILLDDLDKELERRGHSFCRYADDCNIYVKSRRSGERVLKSIGQFLEKNLRLKLNPSKSGVDQAQRRSFLGYSFLWDRKARIRVPKETVQRFKSKAKEIFRRGRGRNLSFLIKEELTPFIRGWINYFRLAEVKQFAEELDGWIRRRLRTIIWKQWKKPRTRMLSMMKRGISEKRAASSASNGRGPWWNSGQPHMNEIFPKRYFDSLGLVSMIDILAKQK